MTGRDKALLFSPSIVGLVLGLGWFVLDPKGDARQHTIDLGVRVLDRIRDAARM